MKLNEEHQLKAPSVFVRIRPDAESGGHAHADAGNRKANVVKRLSSWTNKTVSMTDSHQTVKYEFPKQVIPPNASQNETFDILITDLLQSFLRMEDAYNVLYLAYGQTGTGKTHSIFGPKWSLKNESEENRAQWGIFPRTTAKILEYMDKVRKGEGEGSSQSTNYIQSILTVGAIDFYIGTCVDLLDERKPVEVDTNRVPLGYKERQIENLNDLLSFLQDIIKLRKAFGTRMNEASDDHDGSSRSHCAMILTLRQLRVETGEYVVNKYTMVDLAGAERPSTTGGERVSAFEAWIEIMRGQETTGGTGALINYELHQLGHEVIKATEQHKKKKGYNQMTQLCLPAVQFLGSSFDGSSLLGMLVCLSQAKHCGWETWFSLQYGTTLSKLRCPVKSRPIRNLKKTIEKARKAASNARIQLQNTPQSGGPASKYYPKKRSMAIHTEYQLQWLEKLASMEALD